MSSPNVMEVISRGSFEMEEAKGRGRHSGSSTSLPARPESQLSLEYLAPEELHYRGPLQDPPSDGEPDEVTPTSKLYRRIQKLSEQVRAELGHHGRLDSQEIESAEELGDKAVSLPVGEAIGDRTYQGGAVEDGGELRPEALSPEATLTHEGSSSGQLYAQHMADPKLHRALEKMKKLDARLADLTKKEKEVKQKRRLLEQQNEGGVGLQSLVPMDVDGDTPPGSPVFATQLDERSSIAGDYPNNGPSVDEEGGGRRPERRSSPSHEAGQESRPRQKQQQEPATGVNFIKRNIELAREAGMLVAMTEAEKKRLEELLADEDTLPQEPLTGLASSTSGFSYTEQELERIRDIDSRLQALMPPEDWESVCSSSRNITPALPGSEVETEVSNGERPHALRPIGPSEILQWCQVTREEGQRLAEIDERLLSIKEERRREADMKPYLSQSHLDSLLEQCRRSEESDIAGSNDAQIAEQ